MLTNEKPGGNGSFRPGEYQDMQAEDSRLEQEAQAPAGDPQKQFRQALEAAGLLPPTTGFGDDGQPHEFDGIEAGRFDCRYWYNGLTGGFEIPDGRRWEWQASETRARRAWPEPQPLHQAIAPLDYPLDAFPKAIRAAVGEVQAYTQAPMPLVAGSALSALSIAGQAHIDVRRDNSLSGPASLFMLTVADSGERKSTVDGYFSKAIRDYEAEQAEAKKPELQAHEAKEKAWQAKAAGIKDRIRQLAKQGKPTGEDEQALAEHEKKQPVKPRVPRLFYSDTTSEELGHNLATGYPSGAVQSSEAGLVFGGHAMSADSLMRTLGLYNILWDGGTAHIDRRTSQSFTVKGARLTVALQIQQAALRDFMRRGGELTRGIGFFARCLVAWPQSTQGTRTFKQAPESWPALAAYNIRMSEILNSTAPIDKTGGLTPAMLDLSKEAKASWIEFYNGIESEQGESGDFFDVRDVASKTADNAARIAALFHLYDKGLYGEIGQEHLEGAARISAWHLHEARRFFGGLALSDEQRQLAKLDQWLLELCSGGGGQSVPTREALQRGPSCFRNKVALEAAIDELDELDRARLVERGRQKLIEVNPALLAGGRHGA